MPWYEVKQITFKFLSGTTDQRLPESHCSIRNKITGCDVVRAVKYYVICMQQIECIALIKKNCQHVDVKGRLDPETVHSIIYRHWKIRGGALF